MEFWRKAPEGPLFTGDKLQKTDASRKPAEQRASELIDLDFVNHSAPVGAPNGPESMWHTFQQILRPAIAGLSVTIHDQIVEGDKVSTRKTITGTHTGPLMGVEPTGRPVSIDVIDIVRIKDGRYAEHWGLNTLGHHLGEHVLRTMVDRPIETQVSQLFSARSWPDTVASTRAPARFANWIAPIPRLAAPP